MGDDIQQRSTARLKPLKLQPHDVCVKQQSSHQCYNLRFLPFVSDGSSGFKIFYQKPLGDVTDANPLFESMSPANHYQPSVSLSLIPAVAAWHAADVSSLQT